MRPVFLLSFAFVLTVFVGPARDVAVAQAVINPSLPANSAVNDRHEEIKHKADNAYRQRDYVTTVTLASQVLAEKPNDAVALYLRASAKVEQGIAARDSDVIRAGVEDARSAIQFDPTKKADYYLPYMYGMSHLTKFEGNESHAEMAVTTATKLLDGKTMEPSMKGNVFYQRGIARMQLGDYADAAVDFRSTLEISPSHLGSRVTLADALVKAGDRKGAEAAFNETVETFPSSPLVFNNRGMFFQQQGRVDEAIVDFSQAIALNPEYVTAYLNRGFTLIHNQDPEGAIGDFSHVLTYQPNNAQALSLRGTAYLRRGDTAKAIADYTRTVELDPANSAARADLGFAYFFSGDYKTAAAAFDQSLTLQPNNAFLQPWRYTALVRSNQQVVAEESYAELREKPADQQSWFDGLTLLLMGELAEEEILSRLESTDMRRRDAQVCEAYYFIGVTKQEGEPTKAAAYFRRALRSQAKQLSAYQAAQLALDDLGKRR